MKFGYPYQGLPEGTWETWIKFRRISSSLPSVVALQRSQKVNSRGNTAPHA